MVVNFILSSLSLDFVRFVRIQLWGFFLPRDNAFRETNIQDVVKYPTDMGFLFKFPNTSNYVKHCYCLQFVL